MNDPSNQQDGNSNAQDGGRDFDDRQPDQLDQAARDSLINRAEAEAAQQDQDEESDAMIAHVEGTNEVKSEEDGATAKFTEIGSEQAGLTNQKERQTATDPGMPVKGLQGNTGLAAAGAHHVQTNAAMGGAHDHPAGTSTLEETIGIDKYLRTNTATTATTAAEANHEKASAAVGGPQDLFTLEETALLHPGTRETVQQQQQQILVPGAYPMAGTGISNLTNNDEDEAPVDSSSAALHHVLDPTLFPNQAMRSGVTMDHLAVANRVTDDPEDLMHADPVHVEEQEKRKQEAKKRSQTFLFILFLVVCAVAVIIGTVAGTAGKDDKVVVYQTPSPTVFGSMTPSEVPSSAPSGVLDLLLDNLPIHTLARINNGSETPQWRAWNWLANHQNVTWLPEWRKEQLFALATFFYAFEGENWNPLIKERWMDDTVGECDWFSNGFGFFYEGTFYEYQRQLSCNSHGKFTSLWLENLQISGLAPFIPPEITMLSSLSHLQFAYNDISAAISSLIPADLYEMTDLVSLLLSEGNLTGQIPSELGQLTDLNLLILHENQLSGQIPSELVQLTALHQLSLFQNQISGQIPSEMGQLSALTSLGLGENQFTGPLPSELGRLSDVSHFWFSENQLSGPVPSEFGQMIGLTVLRLEENQISGQIPSEFGQLIGLEVLTLYENQLTGPVPSELALLTNLNTLNLTGNLGLSGTVPEELCFLQNVSCTYGLDWPCYFGFDCTSVLCGCACACAFRNSSFIG